jgi:hypothetical protein
VSARASTLATAVNPVHEGFLDAAVPVRVDAAARSRAPDVDVTTVLRILRHSDLLNQQPALVAYEERREARSAFAKALAGKMAAFS